MDESQELAQQPDSSYTTATLESAAEETENLIEIYQVIADWIRFADAKAAVVLTAAGALLSLLIPTFKPFLDQPAAELPFWWLRYLGVGLFFAWLAMTALACVFAFLCVNPLTRKGKHPATGRCNHFHPAAIAQAYGIDEDKKFTTDYQRLGPEGLKEEVLRGLLIDSHISTVKYHRVSRAIITLGVAAVLGVLYTLATQL